MLLRKLIDITFLIYFFLNCAKIEPMNNPKNKLLNNMSSPMSKMNFLKSIKVSKIKKTYNS